MGEDGVVLNLELDLGGGVDEGCGGFELEVHLRFD